MVKSITVEIYLFSKKIYYFFISLRNYLFSKPLKQEEIKNIPIVINNRNRLTFMLQLIKALEAAGCTNIIIIDNNSTYQPLLEYYASCPYRVIRLERNLGYNALEKMDLYREIKKKYYVYTDSDVVPDPSCPVDFLEHFYKILQKYPLVQKVGFSLKIDNLPDYYEGKKRVVEWESQFFKKELVLGLYSAPIDTTFALHRPYSYISKRGIFKMIRTGVPYTAWHMPWYNDTSNLTEEEKYYIEKVEIGTHWSKGIEIGGDTLLDRTMIKIKTFFRIK